MAPGQGVSSGEDQDHDAGHQGAVFLREAAHGDLGPQGLEQQTSGGGAQDAAPSSGYSRFRSARVRSRVIPGSFLRPQVGGRYSFQPILDTKLGEGFEIAIGGEKCCIHRSGQRGEEHVDLRQHPAAGPQVMVDFGIEGSDR